MILDAESLETAPDSPAPQDGDDADSADAIDSAPLCSGPCDDGLLCTTADTCVAGICQGQLMPGFCAIGQACLMDGDTNPADSCKVCNPNRSTATWSDQPEGAKCGTDKSCQSGVCKACGGAGQACCGSGKGICNLGLACSPGSKTCEIDRAIDLAGETGNTINNDATFCALFQSGRVRCWGTVASMLGIGSGAPSNVAAVPVAGLEDATQISVGGYSVCALRATGAVVCWGVRDGGTPSTVPGVTNATQISVGFGQTCARTADSQVLCWGYGPNNGEIGDGLEHGNNAPPTLMKDVADAKVVAAMERATCVLRSNGKVSCTGLHDYTGLATDTTTVVDLPAAFTATSLTRTANRFCALTPENELWCWGYMSKAPAIVPDVGRVLAVAASSFIVLALQEDHSVWALGYNNHGALGDGTFTAPASHTSPRMIHDQGPMMDVVAMATTSNASVSCLLRKNGSVLCSGAGTAALGDGQVGMQVSGGRRVSAKRTPFVPVVGILPAPSEDGQCYDGADNDGDGKTDLDDSDCAQDLGSALGTSVATGPFAGLYGDYLRGHCSPGMEGAAEAVFVWTAPSAGDYRFDTSGSSFNTVLVAYKDNPAISSDVGCNASQSGASALQLNVATGEKIILVVDSTRQPADAATFTLNITKL